MADYSRDTYRLTNVMHQLLDGGAVIDPRHYVGVRLQQGVPLLDADWNEMQDIRQREAELLIRDFIGDGVPGLGEGFAIAPVEIDNDFAILAGHLALGGWPVINAALVRYGEQTDVPALTTPAGDRTDVVYLDVWEEEIGASGAISDERLVNESIGLETAMRVERRWAVRVAEGVSDFDTLELDEAGHKYTPLARLFRSANARIEPYMILDDRRLGLTLADGLKRPMIVQRGNELVDAVRFSSMLAGLRAGLGFWQQNSLFPVVLSTVESWFAYQNAVNEVLYLAASSEVASDSHNLDNENGLTVITKLVGAQRSLLAVVRQFGSGVPAEMEPVDFYEAHLDGDSARNLDGIQPALDNDDLLGAVLGQETLNQMLLVGSGELPSGDVSVSLQLVDPATAIVAGDQMTITYQVTSELLTPATPEAFNLEMIVSDVRWAAALDAAQIMLAPGEVGTAEMTVTPSATLVPGDFADINLVARADRRSSIVSVQPAQRFTIDAVPPGESFFFYSGSIGLVGGVLEIPRAQIEEEIFEVEFTLVNTSGGAQTHEFRSEHELVFPETLPDGVDPNTWIPNAPVINEGQVVSGASTPLIVPVRAPSLAGVSEDIDATVTVTVTLTAIDGTPIGSGKSATIELPIRVPIA